MDSSKAPTFCDDLARVINSHSRENASNTPDFILAQYLEACLTAFDTAVQQREIWYGRAARPSAKPTIQELEVLLNSEPDTPIEILPDGSIRPVSPPKE